MTALVVLPDVEAAVSAFLRAQPEMVALVDDRVFTVLPAKTRWPAVRIVRFGGSPNGAWPLWIDRPQLQIDTWAERKAATVTIAETARAALAARRDLIGGCVVTGVDFGTFANMPDDAFSPAKPRVRFDVTLTVHPRPAVPAEAEAPGPAVPDRTAAPGPDVPAPA